MWNQSRSEQTRPAAYPLRVAYDAQAFLSANGGTGKGVQLRNLLGPYADNFVGFATKGKNYSNYQLVQEGFGGHQTWQQFSLPRLLHKWRADYFLAPYNIAPLFIPKRTKLILVLHDLILLERFETPNLRQTLNNEFRRFLIPRAISSAHVVLTVSNYTKREIEKRFSARQNQVIPCTISPSWFVEAPRKPTERGNYILSVAGNAPHKNAQGALEGFAKYVAKLGQTNAPRLRFVGLSDVAEEYRRRAATLQIEHLIDFEPYLPEGQLQELYRAAGALLIPSLMEGFGIPVLEAMASGTPVIASNATSLPEVGGTAAAYFNPTNTDEIAATIAQVLNDSVRQQNMIEHGLEQARQFHPDIVGARVRKFWDELAEAHFSRQVRGEESPASFTRVTPQDVRDFFASSGPVTPKQ